MSTPLNKFLANSSMLSDSGKRPAMPEMTMSSFTGKFSLFFFESIVAVVIFFFTKSQSTERYDDFFELIGLEDNVQMRSHINTRHFVKRKMHTIRNF